MTTYGNGLVETSAYNNRLQPTQLRTYKPTTNANVLNLASALESFQAATPKSATK